MKNNYIKIISKIETLHEAIEETDCTKESLKNFCNSFCKVFEIEDEFDFKNNLEIFFPVSMIKIGIIVADLLESNAPKEDIKLSCLKIIFIQSQFFSKYCSFILNHENE